jgi:hypothetical protein
MYNAFNETVDETTVLKRKKRPCAASEALDNYYKRHRKAKLESMKARQDAINAAAALLRGI